jgi:hypothetical protein
MPSIVTPITPDEFKKLATAAKKYVNSIKVDHFQGVAVAISCGECGVNATCDTKRERPNNPYMELRGMFGHYSAKHGGKVKNQSATLKMLSRLQTSA